MAKGLFIHWGAEYEHEQEEEKETTNNYFWEASFTPSVETNKEFLKDYNK